MRPVNREGDPSYISEMKKISQGALEAYMRIWEAVGKKSPSVVTMGWRRGNRTERQPGRELRSPLLFIIGKKLLWDHRWLFWEYEFFFFFLSCLYIFCNLGPFCS